MTEATPIRAVEASFDDLLIAIKADKHNDSLLEQAVDNIAREESPIRVDSMVGQLREASGKTKATLKEALNHARKKTEAIERDKADENATISGNRLLGKHSHDSDVLAEQLRDEFLYDEFLDSWFHYEKVWREETETTVKQYIMREMDTAFPGGYNIAVYSGCYNMLKMRLSVASRDVRGTNQDRWIVDKNLLPLDNGILNLSTGELLPHSPKYLMNWHLPHPWQTSGSMPVTDQFFDFISSSDPHTRNVILCFLAAVLRGMSDLQKYLEIIGIPGTGKSSLIKLAMQLVGEENVATTSMDQLQSNKFETAAFFGKRLAIITDADKYGGSVEVFKAITGQDPIRYEQKNKQQDKPFIFQGMVIVAANQPVQYKDQSTAMTRRRIPVHIDQKLDEAKRDPDLGAKMAAEIPALIYNLVNIPVQEIEAVLHDSEKHRIKSTRRALAETHVLAEWMDENLVLDEGYTAKIGVEQRSSDRQVLNASEWLYPNYVDWAEKTGRKAQVILRTFKKTLCELLQTINAPHSEGRNSDGSYIKGVRIRGKYDTEDTIVTLQPWISADNEGEPPL